MVGVGSAGSKVNVDAGCRVLGWCLRKPVSWLQIQHALGHRRRPVRQLDPVAVGDEGPHRAAGHRGLSARGGRRATPAIPGCTVGAPLVISWVCVHGPTVSDVGTPRPRRCRNCASVCCRKRSCQPLSNSTGMVDAVQRVAHAQRLPERVVGCRAAGSRTPTTARPRRAASGPRRPSAPGSPPAPPAAGPAPAAVHRRRGSNPPDATPCRSSRGSR